MLLGPSHGTQALSEWQTNFSDDFGTSKNDLKKSFGPRTFYLGDQFYFGRIGSPDFMIFRCDLAHLVIFADFAAVMRFRSQDIAKNHEIVMPNLENFVFSLKTCPTLPTTRILRPLTQ